MLVNNIQSYCCISNVLIWNTFASSSEAKSEGKAKKVVAHNSFIRGMVEKSPRGVD